MKINKKTIAFVSVFLLSLCFAMFLSSHTAEAQDRYTAKEPIPGAQNPETSDFIEYLGQIYTFMIAISGILAIFMIAVGAFMYIVTSAGNAAKMADAKDMIYNAIYGLIIALIAWLVMFVVNPDLVRGNIDQVIELDIYRYSPHRSDGLH